MCFAITFTTKIMALKPLPDHIAPGWSFQTSLPLSPGGGRPASITDSDGPVGGFGSDVDIPVILTDSGDEM